MKTIHIFLVALLVMTTSIPSWASLSLSLDGDNPIIIHQLPTEYPNDPRGPVFNPFTAYLMNNQVVLESAASCGLVAVELTSTAGDYYTTVFDTEDGSILIPISGLTGDYDILLTTQEGLCFWGNFGF